MGIRTRRRRLLIGLVFPLTACGQTAEAPEAGDVVTASTTAAAQDADHSPTSSTATTASSNPATATTPTTSPETTTVSDATEPAPTDDLQPASTQPTRVTDPSNGSIDPGLASIADRAVDDLADRLGVSASSITVVATELVVWPDSSLGCPRPGMEYLQVLTDGFRILLQHDATTYSYHGGGSTAEPFLCEQPDKPVTGVSPGGGDS